MTDNGEKKYEEFKNENFNFMTTGVIGNMNKGK